MKFLQLTFLAVFFTACQSKEIKIPVNDNPGLHEVWNNSPVYILMKIPDQDTIADVKLGQTISSTTWLVAADRRLNMKQLQPALEKVYKKRRKVSMHSDGKGRLFFSYLDSLQNKVSFVEGTKIELMPDFYNSKSYFKEYRKADPDNEKIHLFILPNQFVINDSLTLNKDIPKIALRDSLQSISKNYQKPKLYLNFDNRLKYQDFLNIYTFFRNDSLSRVVLSPKIFIFTP
ncbi:MAG TPA: hypothetical protein ENK64_00255 [Flavobacteriales bacterium]|jgi:hypothetical protein|nr:hypothetical protein [Flavobacteriales bacterium]